MTPEQLNSFKIMTRVYYDSIQERIDLDGQLGQTKNGKEKKNIPERDKYLLGDIIEYRDGRQELAEKMIKDLSRIISKEPLWTEFLQHVKGVGPTIAAVIISEIDIHKAPTVSNLWSFAGLAPGKDKKTKGNKCPYNQFLRAKLCGVLGSAFLKAQSQPYSTYYYNEKTRLENSNVIVREHPRRKDFQKGVDPKGREVMWKDAYLDHRHKAAIRKMVKMFLKDLYVAWRTIEGLPVRKPYEEEYLGRKHAMNE